MLGQLFAAQRDLHLQPTRAGLAEFIAETLAVVPGVVSCRVCMPGVSPTPDELDGEACRHCTALREDLAPAGTDAAEVNCALADMPDMHTVALKTAGRRDGFFVFKVDDPDAFAAYEPFLTGFAHCVALGLEGRMQKDLLKKTGERLKANVAARERAEEKLHERADLDQILLDSLPPVAMLLRPKTREIVACNKAGREVGAVPGKTCFGTWGRSDKPCPWCLAPEIWATGKPQHLETEGVGRIWDAHGIPVADDLYLHYASDITERKRAEEERENLITELETQNAELERFTYTVSHDLKSPLVTIKGYLGLLEEDIADGDADAIRDDVKRIAGAADKMDRLLSELLALSQIGRLVNPPENVALEGLAREAVELVGGQIAAGGVQVEISPDLPTVAGDRPRLLEVLQNLIDNAVKYMGDQPRPRVEIGARPDDEETICYVRDNGIGIEPRYQERIFNLFDKLHPKTEGSGVGLALVKRIVEVHGGRIWVESKGAAEGSTFCFTVPPKAPSTDAEEVEK